jgi:hypothetical protein
MRGRYTSDAVVPRAGQSTRERMLNRSFGSDSSVSLTSSQSLGCKGKLADVDLQALTAQVRKLRVRIFMVACVTTGCNYISRDFVLAEESRQK